MKRLRAALPDLRILVGRWAPEALVDETNEQLKADGATHVASALLDTRDDLAGLLDLPRIAVSDQPGVHAAQLPLHRRPLAVASSENDD